LKTREGDKNAVLDCDNNSRLSCSGLDGT